MIAHYLKTAFSQLKWNKFFSGITIAGFTMGIAAAFLIYLWIQDEHAYEAFHENADNIYRVLNVTNENGKTEKTDRTVMPLAKAFREEFPQIKNATFIKYEDKKSLEYQEKIVEGKDVYVDTTFFELFSFPVVEGNPTQALKEPSSIVITDVFAQKLFGNEPALGKEVIKIYFGDKTPLKVGAVVSMPRHSHIGFDIAFSAYKTSVGRHFITNWRSGESTVVYIQVDEGARFDDSTRLSMSTIMQDRTQKAGKLLFQPLKDIHLHSDFLSYYDKNRGNSKYIFIFSGLALLILFMSAFNFTTLATARGSQRTREVAVRKAYGSSFQSLISQFTLETLMQACVAMVFAILLVWLLLPFFNQLSGKEIVLAFSFWNMAAMLAIILITGLLAGAYPSFYLSSMNPILAFRGGTGKGIKSGFVKWLVLVQFVISMVLIIATIAVQKQLNLIKTKDLGLQKENVITVNTNLWYDVGAFKKVIIENPNIEAVAMGGAIADWTWKGGMAKWITTTGLSDSTQMTTLWVDGDFDDVYGLQMLKGEFLRGSFEDYWGGGEQQAVINETAAKLMGLEDPIGTKINEKIIVGVVKDFHFRPLHEQIAPLIIEYSPEAITYLHIKIRPENQAQTLAFIKQNYERMNAGKVFDYEYFENQLNDNYRAERQQGAIFILFTLLSLFISALGVLGLVAFSTQRRMKEIGIRKVNGARPADIVALFTSEYLRWLLVAFAIAAPVGWYIMHEWLGNFAYRTSLSWWIFILAGLVAVFMALSTVCLQSFRAAMGNPIDRLRTE